MPRTSLSINFIAGPSGTSTPAGIYYQSMLSYYAGAGLPYRFGG